MILPRMQLKISTTITENENRQKHEPTIDTGMNGFQHRYETQPNRN